MPSPGPDLQAEKNRTPGRHVQGNPCQAKARAERPAEEDSSEKIKDACLRRSIQTQSGALKRHYESYQGLAVPFATYLIVQLPFLFLILDGTFKWKWHLTDAQVFLYPDDLMTLVDEIYWLVNHDSEFRESYVQARNLFNSFRFRR